MVTMPRFSASDADMVGAFFVCALTYRQRKW